MTYLGGLSVRQRVRRGKKLCHEANTDNCPDGVIPPLHPYVSLARQFKLRDRGAGSNSTVWTTRIFHFDCFHVWMRQWGEREVGENKVVRRGHGPGRPVSVDLTSSVKAQRRIWAHRRARLVRELHRISIDPDGRRSDRLTQVLTEIVELGQLINSTGFPVQRINGRRASHESGAGHQHQGEGQVCG